MIFSLDVLPAHKGDCLVLHYGSQDSPRLILIDGGPSGVYVPQLKPRLQRIHRVRKLARNAPLPVDVVMVSHIDDDHIKGIIELTKEQLFKSPDLRLRVKSLWHNSFEDLIGGKADRVLKRYGASAVQASAGRNTAFDGLEADDEETHQAVEVLASISQGRQLRDDRITLHLENKGQQWSLNHKFGGDSIVATAASKPVTFEGGLTMTVVGPMQEELDALHKAHDKWVSKHPPKDVLAAFVDKSVPNLSSIVVLAELGGKTILLTGDARGDRILQGLELVGLVKKDGKLHVDILKVPHHGSQNNMETGFFKRVTADHYVFSGDGQHGNPERETLEMLLKARGVDEEYEIHLTYSIEEIDKAREANWINEQGKEKKRKKKSSAQKPKAGKKKIVEVRADWSPAKHGLAALFKKNPKFANKLEIVDGKEPHLINLFDKVKL
jgi:beta-lactamase superfamily II metal-dependent hydrolase